MGDLLSDKLSKEEALSLAATELGHRRELEDKLRAYIDWAAEVTGEPEKWPEPIPLGAPGRPFHLVIDGFPSWMREHIESVAGNLQVPVDLPALLALCLTSGALQKKAEVHVQPGWKEPLTLWGCAVLDSGTRKSPTFKAMATPIYNHETALREAIREEHIKARDHQEVLEARLKRAKQQAAKAKDDDLMAARNDVEAAREELDDHYVPPMPQLHIDDITSEELLRLMSKNNGRLLAMSPEGDLFKYMAGRYDTSNAVLNVYKKAWTGEEPARDNRVTREGTDVPNPALAVAICTQPVTLQEMAQKQTFRGEGLLARFLYVVPESKVGRRLTGPEVPPLDSTAKRVYEDKMDEILHLEPREKGEDGWTPYTMRLTEEARVALWSWWDEVEVMLAPGEALDGMVDWGSKLVGQTVRIAGVLQVARAGRLDGEVTKQCVDDAVIIAEGLIDHARAAYHLLNANDKVQLARYVWRRLCEILGLQQHTLNTQYTQKGVNGAVTGAHTGNSEDIEYNEYAAVTSKRELHQACRGKDAIGSAADLDAPLQQLEDHGLIRIRRPKTDGPGRPPSPIIEVNPRAAS